MAENTEISASGLVPNPTGRQLGAYKAAAKRAGLSFEEWHRRRMSRLRFCWACKAWKDVELFARDSTRYTGRTSQCRSCSSDRSKASKYRVSMADIVSLKARHQDGCAVCKRHRRIVVDHDHSTGALRGMLCDRCNQGLGFFADDPALLRRAAEYLEKPQRAGRELDGQIHDGFPA